MEADCLEGDRSRGLPRWPARLRLRSGASAAAAIGAMIVGTGARIAGTDGRDIPRFTRRGGSDRRRDLETPPQSAAHMVGQNDQRASREIGPDSVVGVLEVGIAVVVECADAFDAVGVHSRAPVGLHHDRDGLLDRLPLAHVHSALDRLYRRW